MWYEWSSLAVSFLTLCVLAWTLWVVRGYAADTNTLARCAVEQAPRPCLDVLAVRDVSTRSILESAVASLEGLTNIVLQNIGTAPAVNVSFWIGSPDQLKSREFTFGPTINSGDKFDTGHSRNALVQSAIVVVEYQSVAGRRFGSEIAIDDRRWIKSAKFRTA